jgi:hypothetical protein
MPLLRLVIVAAVAALIASAAFAQEKQSFESLWAEATEGEHTLTAYGDYTMVDRGDVYWYFTKPGHDAYPGVIRRALTQANGRFFIDTQGWSFAAEAGQPGFKRWLAEFEALNRRMIEELERQVQGK